MRPIPGNLALTFYNLAHTLNLPSVTISQLLEVQLMRILIAEEDVLISSFLSEGLTAEQYDVRVATSIHLVPQWIAEDDYNLLILNSSSGGTKVLRQVRNIKPHLPVLV